MSHPQLLAHVLASHTGRGASGGAGGGEGGGALGEGGGLGGGSSGVGGMGGGPGVGGDAGGAAGGLGGGPGAWHTQSITCAERAARPLNSRGGAMGSRDVFECVAYLVDVGAAAGVEVARAGHVVVRGTVVAARVRGKQWSVAHR